MEHVNTEENGSTTQATQTPSRSRRKRASASNGERPKRSRSKSAAKQANATNESKADVARNIFKKMGGKASRKEVIEAFVNDAGLSPAGASTYYQRFSHEDPDAPRRGRGRPPKGEENRSGNRRGGNVSRGDANGSRKRAEGKETKIDAARAIFKKMGGKKPRKEVIEAFMSEAGLSAAGASTYYQKLKSAA